jgi:hypothetical protein
MPGWLFRFRSCAKFIHFLSILGRLYSDLDLAIARSVLPRCASLRSPSACFTGDLKAHESFPLNAFSFHLKAQRAALYPSYVYSKVQAIKVSRHVLFALLGTCSLLCLLQLESHKAALQRLWQWSVRPSCVFSTSRNEFHPVKRLRSTEMYLEMVLRLGVT